ncbi:efflux RND transporter periplasmic adaptor subunit [Oceanobacter sp. 5_MG-2023]|uniref:efflux RND transporter periplasmic adaptor subunit n=1 Tax=Oceanobacter sp. 5_MG-2023 TaxID=3062645 RepID=UPI0026E3E6CF|nr:efflux RND transporter periplasmic adaptor subunit [Oceanobacter sp. 5_MG-2023]MDO6681738.1 efflux RND transporter periplasmic adaptor subunit [Oceanobacter sp. 5_MG-2023]
MCLSLFSLLAACSEADNSRHTPAEPTARPGKIYEVVSSQDALLRRFPGKVEASEEVSLAFRVPGELQTLPALAGKQVKMGDILARLDPTDYQLQLDERQARFELASSQFQRIENLFQKNQVSKAQYDQARADLAISKAALGSARSNMNYTTLKAPFSGVVAEVYVDNHQSVAAGTPLLKLQARGQLVVSIQVPEQLMIQISRSGSSYQPDVVFDALPGKRFKATYKEHNTQADPATGSYRLLVTLPKPADLNPLPGMSASVYADLNQILAVDTGNVLIPSTAIFQQSNQADGSKQGTVWKLDEHNTLVAQAVETGRLTQAGLEIVAGLQAGDRILAAGVHQAQAGMTIRPWVQERGL